MVDLYAPTAEELAEMHQGLTTLNKAAIQFMLSQCLTIDPKTGKNKVAKAPDVVAIRRLWEMVKAEKLEPTAVQKNENSMSSEDRDLLSSLLDQNYDEDEDDL